MRHPDHPKILHTLVGGTYNGGELESALQMFEKARSLDPGRALALNNICASYNGLRRFEEAIQACEKSIELQPGFELAQNNLAWAKSQR
jgi:Flp pilus assembly protein TadD